MVAWTAADWELFWIMQGFAALTLVALIQAANNARNRAFFVWATQNVYPLFKPPPIFYVITAPIVVLATGTGLFYFFRANLALVSIGDESNPAVNQDFWTSGAALAFSVAVLLVLREWLIDSYGQLGFGTFVSFVVFAGAVCTIVFFWLAVNFLPAIIMIPFGVYCMYIFAADVATWWSYPRTGVAPEIYWPYDLLDPLNVGPGVGSVTGLTGAQMQQGNQPQLHYSQAGMQQPQQQQYHIVQQQPQQVVQYVTTSAQQSRPIYRQAASQFVQGYPQQGTTFTSYAAQNFKTK